MSAQYNLESSEEDVELHEHLEHYDELHGEGEGEGYEEYIYGDEKHSYDISEEATPAEDEDDYSFESVSETSAEEIQKSLRRNSRRRSEEDSPAKRKLRHLYLDEPDQFLDLLAALPEDISDSLKEYWTKMEQTYGSPTIHSLEGIETCHEELLDYPQTFTKEYLSLLEAPDTRTRVAENFKSDFNRVHPTARNDVRIKPILHKRINEFLLKLEGVTEDKYAGSKTEAYKLLNTGFLTAESERMATLFGALLQAQTDRFVDTIKFINNHYYNVIAVDLGVPNKIAWKELAGINLINKSLYCQHLRTLQKCSGSEQRLEGSKTDLFRSSGWDDAALLKFLDGRGDAEGIVPWETSTTDSSGSVPCGDDQDNERGICNDDKDSLDDEDDVEENPSDEEESNEEEGMDDDYETQKQIKLSGEMQQAFKFDNEFQGEGEIDMIGWNPQEFENEEQEEVHDSSNAGKDGQSESRVPVASSGKASKDKLQPAGGDKNETQAPKDGVKETGKGKAVGNRKSKAGSANGKRRRTKTAQAPPPPEVKEKEPSNEKGKRRSKEPSSGKIKQESQGDRTSKSKTVESGKGGGEAELVLEEEEHLDEEEVSEGALSNLELTENEELELEYSRSGSEGEGRKDKFFEDEQEGEDAWEWWDPDYILRFSDGSSALDRRSRVSDGLREREPIVSFDEQMQYIRDHYWDESTKPEATEASSAPAQTASDQGKDKAGMFDEEEYFDDEDVFYQREEFFEEEPVKPKSKFCKNLKSTCKPEPADLHYSIFGRDDEDTNPVHASLLQKLTLRQGSKTEIGKELTEDKKERKSNKSLGGVGERPSKLVINSVTTPIIPEQANKSKKHLTYHPLLTIGPPTVYISPSLAREQGFAVGSPFLEETKRDTPGESGDSTHSPASATVEKILTGQKRPLFESLMTQQDEIWNGFDKRFNESKGNIDKLATAIKTAISRGYPAEPVKKAEPATNTETRFPLVPPRDLSDVRYAKEGFEDPNGEAETEDYNQSKKDRRSRKGRLSKLHRPQKKVDTRGSTGTRKGELLLISDPPTTGQPPNTAITDDEDKPVETILSSTPKSSLTAIKAAESLEGVSDSHGRNASINAGSAEVMGDRKIKMLQRTPAKLDVRTDSDNPEDVEKLDRRARLAEILKGIQDGEDLPQVSEIKAKLRAKLQNWEKALELEVQRLTRQLATIQSRAQEELQLFKDLPFQVWESSKKQASDVYIDDLKRDDEIGEVFHSAINAGSELYGKFYIDRRDLMLLLNGAEPPIPLDYPEELRQRENSSTSLEKESREYTEETVEEDEYEG